LNLVNRKPEVLALISDPEFARAMLNLYPAEQMEAWPAAKGYGGKPQRDA
jgi:hypothetical protein